MNPKSFFGELRRRNVYKVAVAYAVVGGCSWKSPRRSDPLRSDPRFEAIAEKIVPARDFKKLK